MSFSRPSKRALLFGLFFLCAFAFRLFFGLTCPPIIVGEDETQIYAIGLKSHTTGTWPTFGPDVVSPDTAFTPQIPRALHGLLVALPLALWPHPVAPFVFLNLLSLLALAFLGWYVLRRVPSLPPLFVYGWLFLAPWTTHYTTQVLNPSYAAIGAILFYVGFLETLPPFQPAVLPRSVANALMGFGLLWVYQLHMSWVLLGPCLALSLFFQTREGRLPRALSAAALGALPMVGLLVPTFLRHGLTTLKDVRGFSSGFDASHLLGLPSLVGKFLSFASFEMPRFIGPHTQERVDFLLAHPLLLVPGVFLWVVGLAQPLAMLFLALTRKDGGKDWTGIRWTTLGCVLLSWAAFWFSAKSIGSNAIYVTFPLAFIFSFYAWGFGARSRAWRAFGWVFLAMAVWFQLGYALVGYKEDASVYLRTRENMRQAIEQSDYRLLTERRPGARY